MTTALASARAADSQLAPLFVDLDDFKRVNDRHGHLVGDTLLQAVGQRLRAVVRSGDVLARPADDEFLLLFKNVDDVSELAAELAARVLDSLREPFVLEGQGPLAVRASVGVSTFPRDADTIEDLMRRADVAMYIAKGGGKDSFHINQARATPTGYRDDDDDGAAWGGMDELNELDELDELERILSGCGVTAVFQPHPWPGMGVGPPRSAAATLWPAVGAFRTHGTSRPTPPAATRC
ncbi:MAG: diguanylate cyclase domain-containing protein [Solirubrobacteraceae bacterium]